MLVVIWRYINTTELNWITSITTNLIETFKNKTGFTEVKW